MADTAFLKAIFGDRSMTLDELSAALDSSKDVKLANLAGGRYVDKEKYSALETKNKTLADQLAKLGEAKPEELQAEISRLRAENEQAEQKYQQALLDHAVESKLMSEGAVDTRAVRALLDMSKIHLDGDNLIGADEQISALKKDKAWAFPTKEAKIPKIDGVVPAANNSGNEQSSDIAMINGLLGL